MENPKIEAPLKEKIKFLVLTYITVVCLWLLAGHLAAVLTPVLGQVGFFKMLFGFDGYKIILIFILLFLIGNYLDKSHRRFNVAILFLRFCVIIFLICGVNIRWNIVPLDSEYFSYIYNIAYWLVLAQMVRILLLRFSDSFEKYLKPFTIAITMIIVGIVIYVIFTISERQANHSTVLQIDQYLIDYLKYPMILLLFMADYAFVKNRPFSKSLPYHLYDLKISEPLKAASARLRLLFVFYVVVAGIILSEELLRG